MPEKDFDIAEYIKNNGHPKYAQLVSNGLPLRELSGLFGQSVLIR